MHLAHHSKQEGCKILSNGLQTSGIQIYNSVSIQLYLDTEYLFDSSKMKHLPYNRYEGF